MKGFSHGSFERLRKHGAVFAAVNLDHVVHAETDHVRALFVGVVRLLGAEGDVPLRHASLFGFRARSFAR